MIRSALNYTLWLLSKRDYSTYKIVEKLKQKKYSEDEINQTLKKLQELGFLDDQKYAERFVESKRRQSGNGSRLIYQKLLQKGISKEIITQVLGQDEVEDIKKTAQNWLKRRPQNEANQKQKLFAYLSRRGYDYSFITEALKNSQD